ncbi:MAG: trehalose-phosphatase [Phycisphaeraceae bacterium]|nr:trehalose-phosphatase [Phycisphaeraceae bacterium]
MSPNEATEQVSLDAVLTAKIEQAARAAVLLVACDFDGTLSPIAPTPDAARVDGPAFDHLACLGRLERTSAGVISGRGVTDLRTKLPEEHPLVLIGSHGQEWAEESWGLTDQEQHTLLALIASAQEVTRGVPGAIVERKPASVSVHFRECAPADAARLADAAAALTAELRSVEVLQGHMVVELCVRKPDKGQALERLRYREGATCTFFIGDDVTDERAFGVLGEHDLGIKIGPGETSAACRVPDQRYVAAVLGALADARAKWIAECGRVPIEQHTFLSDQRTVAIVEPGGSLCWMCLPRIDSPALFASLLGGEERGAFRVHQEGEDRPVSLGYVDDSMITRAAWSSLTVTDYFDCSQGRPYQRAGRSDLIRVIEGTGRARVVFSPRLDFGRLPTRLIIRDDGIEVDGGPDPIVLHAPGIVWEVQEQGAHHTANALIDLDGSKPVILELRYGTAQLKPYASGEPLRRDQTRRFWSGWAGTLDIAGPHANLLRRSALVLKALCQGPNGAIAAAGTSSLPEHLGGQRNWDYRFCWPRDAAMAARSLTRLGNTGVAMKLLDWLGEVVEQSGSPERLRPVYSVAGAELGVEGEISELIGYGESRPVRVGNGAAHQVQLDVFGPIVDLVAALAEHGAPVTPEHWRLVESMVDAVSARWREPDHGIWEIRGPKRHHVHSKVMCWHAVDRALTVATLGMGRSRPDWVSLRDEIKDDVLKNGWNDGTGAYTAAYDERAMDAASLVVGLTGLLPHDHPRWRMTVEAVERDLCDRGMVHRYRYDDGLPGREGAWFICTWWFIESLVTIGRREDAARYFEGMIAKAGPLGLFPEEWDMLRNIGLGNFPQAYSHLAVINASLALHR